MPRLEPFRNPLAVDPDGALQRPVPRRPRTVRDRCRRDRRGDLRSDHHALRLRARRAHLLQHLGSRGRPSGRDVLLSQPHRYQRLALRFLVPRLRGLARERRRPRVHAHDIAAEDDEVPPVAARGLFSNDRFRTGEASRRPDGLSESHGFRSDSRRGGAELARRGNGAVPVRRRPARHVGLASGHAAALGVSRGKSPDARRDGRVRQGQPRIGARLQPGILARSLHREALRAGQALRARDRLFRRENLGIPRGVPPRARRRGRRALSPLDGGSRSVVPPARRPCPIAGGRRGARRGEGVFEPVSRDRSGWRSLVSLEQGPRLHGSRHRAPRRGRRGAERRLGRRRARGREPGRNEDLLPPNDPEEQTRISLERHLHPERRGRQGAPAHAGSARRLSRVVAGRREDRVRRHRNGVPPDRRRRRGDGRARISHAAGPGPRVHVAFMERAGRPRVPLRGGKPRHRPHRSGVARRDARRFERRGRARSAVERRG